MLHDYTLELLVLLVCANGAPILARNLMGNFGNHPIDAGLVGSDGRRLLGASKTVRGIVAAILTGGCVSWMLGLGIGFGALFAFVAMLGDLFSSFIKRRLGLASSTSAPGLDQIPESLLPLLVAALVFDLQWIQVGVAVLAFVILEIVLSPLLYCMKIRRKPF